MVSWALSSRKDMVGSSENAYNLTPSDNNPPRAYSTAKTGSSLSCRKGADLNDPNQENFARFMGVEEAMIPLHLYLISRVCKDAAGAAGNIFAIGLFMSPISTFRRIVRNKSTEHFSGLPYIYALLNGLICMWYGSPLVSDDNLLVMTVNSAGAVSQFVYIILFITYADKANKVRMTGFLLAIIGAFAVVVAGSLQIPELALRRITVGLLSGASLISMFASPLFVINLVIRTKSVEFMPFYLSLSTFLMSTSFLLYGLFNDDVFIYVPNGIGTVLGSIQLVLYFYFKRRPKDRLKEPLVAPIA